MNPIAQQCLIILIIQVNNKKLGNLYASKAEFHSVKNGQSTSENSVPQS